MHPTAPWIALGAILTLTPSGARAQSDAEPTEGAPSEASEDALEARAEAELDRDEAERGALEARLAELEARDREREARLAQALERLDELERGAAPASDPATAPVPDPPAAPSAPSAPTVGVRPIASLFTRYEMRTGYDGLGAAPPGCRPGDGDCIRYRARLGLETTPLTLADDVRVSARFLPQVAGHWAMPTLALGPGGPTTPPSSGGTFDPLLGVHEARVTLTLGAPVRLEIGRFELVYGDHVVVGNLDWHPNARAFDGARVRIQPVADGVWIDAFFTLIGEANAANVGYGDRYFYGAYAGLGALLGAGSHLDAYALALQTNDSLDPVSGVERDWSLRVTIGARLRHRIDVIDLRAEGALQAGRQGGLGGADGSVVLAGFALGEVGLNLLEDALRISLEGNFASGDDPSTLDVNEAYDHLFPTGHLFLGLSDVMGARSNIASGVLRAMVKPIPQLSITLDGHAFLRPERGAAASNFAGAEADLHLVWRPGAGLRGRAMYAIFVPNGEHWGPGSGDPVHYLELELGYFLP